MRENEERGRRMAATAIVLLVLFPPPPAVRRQRRGRLFKIGKEQPNSIDGRSNQWQCKKRQTHTNAYRL
jgi:hypothetical protein